MLSKPERYAKLLEKWTNLPSECDESVREKLIDSMDILWSQMTAKEIAKTEKIVGGGFRMEKNK